MKKLNFETVKDKVVTHMNARIPHPDHVGITLGDFQTCTIMGIVDAINDAIDHDSKVQCESVVDCGNLATMTVLSKNDHRTKGTPMCDMCGATFPDDPFYIVTRPFSPTDPNIGGS